MRTTLAGKSVLRLINMSRMLSATSKCKMPLQDWNGSKPNLVPEGKNWMRQIDLATSIVVSHQVFVDRKKYIHAHGRPDKLMLICDVGLTSGYRSRVVLSLLMNLVIEMIDR